MTPKLMDRLARLETAREAQNGGDPIPPVLIGAYLEAIAIALGGYPRPPGMHPAGMQDSISDGFARGLGYLDRDNMEARLEVDPDDWQDRMIGAEAALTARYVKNPAGEGIGRDPTFQMMVGILDEIGHAKASKAQGEPHHWPSENPQLDRAAKSIRRALAMFNIVSEEQIAEACRCH